MRRFVIGDIHGCSKALRTVLAEIQPTADDEVVFLGDYIDRGPDSRNVVDQIIELKNECSVIPLRGNHEVMLSGIIHSGLDPTVWLKCGGHATVASYGGKLSRVPQKHLDFYQALRPYYETDDAAFIHANYIAGVPFSQLDDAMLYWTHLVPPYPQPHESGKRVFVGHTPQANGFVLDLGHLVCVDTYCFGGGYLTAMEIGTDAIYRADRHGHLFHAAGATRLIKWSRKAMKALFRSRAAKADKVT